MLHTRNKIDPLTDQFPPPHTHAHTLNALPFPSCLPSSLKLNFQGNAHLDKNEVDQAIECYDKAIPLSHKGQEGVLRVMRSTAYLQRAYTHFMQFRVRAGVGGGWRQKLGLAGALTNTDAHVHPTLSIEPLPLSPSTIRSWWTRSASRCPTRPFSGFLSPCRPSRPSWYVHAYTHTCIHACYC
jgi:hypothetical protein